MDKKEISSFFALLTAVIIIEIWEDAKLFGKKEILMESVEQVLIVLFFMMLTWVLVFKKKKAV